MIILSSLASSLGAVLSVTGAGYVLVRVILGDEERGNLSAVERIAAGLVAGMLVMSVVLLGIGAVGLFRPLPILLVEVIGICGAALLVKDVRASASTGRTPFDAPFMIVFGALILVAVIQWFEVSSSMRVHPDALQYHIALPQQYLLHGRIRDFPTIDKDQFPLVSELLFAFTLDQAHPERLLASKYLNMVLGGAVFPATWILARRLGALPIAAMLMTLLLASTPNISVGYLKNDAVAAFAAVMVFWGGVCFRERGGRWSILTGVLIGAAFSLKIITLPASAAMMLWLFLSNDHGRKPVIAMGFTAFLAALPWMTYTAVMGGAPLFVFGSDMSEFRRMQGAKRNSNGLTLTLKNYVTYAVPMLIDRGYKVSGNWSLGMPFLGVLFVGIGMLFFRAFWMSRMVIGSALFALVLFSIRQFEGRFLTRYVSFVPALFFAGIAPLLNRIVRHRWACRGLVVVTIAVTVMSSNMQHRLSQVAKLDLPAVASGRS